eukprot:EG_transcript_27513
MRLIFFGGENFSASIGFLIASEGTKVPNAPKCKTWREDCIFSNWTWLLFSEILPASQQVGPSCSQLPQGNFKQNPFRFPFPYKQIAQIIQAFEVKAKPKDLLYFHQNGPARLLRPVHGRPGVCQRRVGSLKGPPGEQQLDGSGPGLNILWCVG